MFEVVREDEYAKASRVAPIVLVIDDFEYYIQAQLLSLLQSGSILLDALSACEIQFGDLTLDLKEIADKDFEIAKALYLSLEEWEFVVELIDDGGAVDGDGTQLVETIEELNHLLFIVDD